MPFEILILTYNNYLCMTVSSAGGASMMEFCLLFRGQILPFLESIDVVKQFPFYRNLSIIQFDIVNNYLISPSPYPVSQFHYHSCLALYHFI